jgi:hypothetical protein
MDDGAVFCLSTVPAYFCTVVFWVRGNVHISTSAVYMPNKYILRGSHGRDNTADVIGIISKWFELVLRSSFVPTIEPTMPSLSTASTESITRPSHYE